MLEQMIAEIKDRHSKQPISQEAYNMWRSLVVTKRLFEDLELAVVDKFREYIDEQQNSDYVAMKVMKREGAAEMVEAVLDWTPPGLEGLNDED